MPPWIVAPSVRFCDVLRGLDEKFSVPLIYISHDMAEIEYLADHLVMMERGTITAAGPLHILQRDPALPLAASHEAAVSLDAVVGGYDGRYGLLILRLKGARLLVPAPALAPGLHQRLRIAANDFSVTREAPRSSTILNVFPARIIACFALGPSEITLVLALGTGGSGTDILARITRYSFDSLGLKDGMDVFAQLRHVSLVSASEPPSLAMGPPRQQEIPDRQVPQLKNSPIRGSGGGRQARRDRPIPSRQSSSGRNMASIACSPT